MAIYLLNRGANPRLKNSDGNTPSEMTSDPELKFLLDNYEEYKRIQQQNGSFGTITSPFLTNKKSISSPVGKYIAGTVDINNGVYVDKRTAFDNINPAFNNNMNQSYKNQGGGFTPQNNYQSSQPMNSVNQYQNGGYSPQAMNNVNQYQNGGFSPQPMHK